MASGDGRPRFGAVGDATYLDTAVIAKGSNLLSGNYACTEKDVAKDIVIVGAGPGGRHLHSTIRAVDGVKARLADKASTAVNRASISSICMSPMCAMRKVLSLRRAP